MDTTAIRTAAAQDIVGVSAEIWSHHSDSPLGVTAESVAEGLAEHDLETEILKLPFYVSNETLSEPLAHTRPAGEPRFQLTRRVLNFARHFGKRHMPPLADLETVSPYEEFNFATSIAYHRYNNGPDAAPSIILSDIHGQPSVYQKSHGAPLAYAWRNAFVDTEAGVRLVPQDSLIRAIYPPGGEPQARLRGLGIVALNNYRPLDVEFVRFSIGNLPARAYHTLIRSCLQREPAFSAYLKDVRQLNPTLVSLRSAQWLSADRTITAR